MTFLNPLVLLGLAAAAIPLLIHLFNFRRPRKVDFSSLAFLQELQQTTMQRVRIKQWLLLALRTLAIACLVLAFARPTIEGPLAGRLGGRAPATLAVIVDNSLSMTLRDAQGEYLEQARRLASGLLDQMEEQDEAYVIPLSAVASGLEAPYQTRGAALDAVAALEAVPGTGTLAAAAARVAAHLAENGTPNAEVYLVTDLQRATLADSSVVVAADAVPVAVLAVGTRTYDNVAVAEVRVESRIIEAGQPVRLAATLVNHGREALDDYVASLLLEGERVAQATADLPPGVPTTVTFTATPQRRGWLAGTVQIEDDAFPPDNARPFTLHVPERRKLLLVQGEEQRVDHVTLALSPELAPSRVAFDVRTIAESALAATGLGAFDAVLLVGPRTLSSGEVAALSRYVRGGGGLLFFPAQQAAAADYNALLDSLGAGTFSGFSGQAAGTAGTGQPIAGLERVDLEHPLFEGVFGQRGGAVRVEQPDVYQAMNYSPGTGAEQTLMQLSNGFPLLQEVRHGDGVALLMAVAPDPRWSDLPVRGLFIPLLYRSVYYLSSGEAATGEQLVVGRGGTLRLAGVAEAEQLRLTTPAGEAFLPEQRRLFGAVLMEVGPEAVPEPGIYDVLAGERLVRRLAAGLPLSESDLARAEPDAAAEVLTQALGRDVRVLTPGAGDEAALLRTLAEARAGRELWNVFLLLALIFLVAEMMVARQWRPETVSA